MTGKGIIFKPFHVADDIGPEGVQVDVTDEFQEIRLSWHRMDL